MTKDYAKYTTYQKSQFYRSRLWIMLALVLSVFIFGLGLVYLKGNNKQEIVQQKTEDKLKQKILEAPAPKPPEPKFDFYNILSQDNAMLPSQATDDVTLSSSNAAPSVSPHVKKPLDGLLSTTPEQVAIAEAKKQLDQEMSQLSNDNYLLIVGNFSDAAQAEQYQAKALLRGFSVHSKVNTVKGKTSYQLFLGPYSGIAVASQEQKRLNSAGIQAMLLKLTP
jgi:cell division protein FtsN